MSNALSIPASNTSERSKLHFLSQLLEIGAMVAEVGWKLLTAYSALLLSAL